MKFNEKVNILLGDNAQGKTNLIESIYISSVGKSFRTSKDSEMVKFGSEFSIIKVCAERDEEFLNIEIAITKDGKKGIKADGVKIKKISELLQYIYCVVFSPEDLKIVKEDPEKRRKFIDKVICQLKPSYANVLSQYKKCIQQRNAVLKDIKFGKDEYLLDIWDDRVALYGAEVMQRRYIYIKKVYEIAKKFHYEITGGKEESNIYYEPDIEFIDNKEEQKLKINEVLKNNRKIDIKNGSTGKGPHKDDICIKINNIDVRKYASQGQQRTMALSLKLSEINLIKNEIGEMPVLLLDDVLSELDIKRQNYLIKSLKDVQIFITTAELTEDIKNSLSEGKIFNVHNGEIIE